MVSCGPAVHAAGVGGGPGHRHGHVGALHHGTQACVPGAATKIVFDRYHATTQVTKALDEVRWQEYKALKPQDDIRLQGTKHLWLWNAENVPEWRPAEFDAVKQAKHKMSRAWAIKEALRPCWSYVYPKCPAKYTA